MGGSVSTNSVSIAQNMTNNAMQSSNNLCVAQCGTSNQNVNVNIVDSSDIDVNFSSTCTVAGTSCTVKNALDTSITNILQASTKQTVVNVSNLLEVNDSNNYASMSQNVRNNMAQLINNVCKNISKTQNENIYVYISGSKDVKATFTQSSSVSNANCAFDNTAKIVAYNSATAKSSQAVKNIGILGAIMIIIVLIIGAFVLVAMLGGLKKSQNKNDQKQQGGKGGE